MSYERTKTVKVTGRTPTSITLSELRWLVSELGGYSGDTQVTVYTDTSGHVYDRSSAYLSATVDVTTYEEDR